MTFHHWNYFLAIEDDTEHINRYVEFVSANLSVYSIEIARILMTSTQEVDVLLKQICATKGVKCDSEAPYRANIPGVYPNIVKAQVEFPRFSLVFTPFESSDKKPADGEEIIMSTEKDKKLTVFEGKRIRKTLHNGVWWFVIVDVVAALTDSANPSGYLRDMRRRDPSLAEAFQGGGQFAPPLALEFPTAGGCQKIQCWNTEGIFRLIQSIPSPKAEPFKRWLARVGKERIDEIENPELAMTRMQELYEKKGYPKEWIDKRLRGIAVSQDLTDEWKDRGAATRLEFAILTNEIMQGAFGLKVDEYNKSKTWSGRTSAIT